MCDRINDRITLTRSIARIWMRSRRNRSNPGGVCTLAQGVHSGAGVCTLRGRGRVSTLRGRTRVCTLMGQQGEMLNDLNLYYRPRYRPELEPKSMTHTVWELLFSSFTYLRNFKYLNSLDLVGPPRLITQIEESGRARLGAVPRWRGQQAAQRRKHSLSRCPAGIQWVSEEAP